MHPQQGDGPDSSSIKPVSSLRSKFENLTSTATRSSTPTQPTSVQPASYIQAQADFERPRASLDLPRHSPWNSPIDPVKRGTGQSDSIQPNDNVQKRVWDQGSPRQRPLSMGTWSRPNSPSPPAVTLQSPVSPPKPLFGSLDRPRKVRSPTRPSFDVPSRVFSAHSPIASPRPQTPPRSKSTADTDLVRPTNPSPLVNVKVPPPVNRAKKPGTPTVANFIPTALEPQLEETRGGDKSPFSTPPEDESPDKHAPQVPVLTKPNPSNAHTKPTSYFPPPPTHHAVEATRRNSEQVMTGPSRYRSLHNGSKSLAQPGSQTYEPEQRPQLPNRRNISPGGPDSRLAPSTPRGSLDERRRSPSPAPPRPSEESKRGLRPSMDMARPTAADLMPPPRRVVTAGTMAVPPPPTTRSLAKSPEHRVVSNEISVPPRQTAAPLPHAHEPYDETSAAASTDYPDASQTNRRPPRTKFGVPQVYPDYDTRSLDMCGDYVCTTGYYTKAWDLKSGRMILEHSLGEREVKVTASAFKPSGNKEQDGQFIWLGNNYGEIQELDIRSREVVQTKSSAHNARCIVEMHRYRSSILSIDDDGKLHLWPAGNDGAPSLSIAPLSFRVSRGHTFSVVLQRYLWIASGKEIRVYDPSSQDQFHITTQALVQPNLSEVTTGAVISNQLDNVYFGHSDGKVSIYSASKLSCIAVVNVSAYRISTMSGAGQYLWAGFSTGMIYVYDTTTSPWIVKKDWPAHQHPVAKIVTDRSSVWKHGHMQVASLGLDNTIRLWDGFLEDDWVENDMQDHDVEYCDFREMKTVIVTWNAGASTPNSLRYDEKDTNFFRKLIQPKDPPDLLVFGFQELVDLEDKKLTAKSFFKSSKKKDTTDVDHMSRQYRAWRDYLVRLLEEEIPQTTTYHLLHTANMVGLFSCVFVRSTLRTSIRSLSVGEVKRGLGGLHGNKGALILRFILDDSSICLVNCHLAAGQTQTVNRNNDASAILESSVLPRETDLDARAAVFVGGGDGSMVMDHEICFLNGDLNYRIDTMGRDTVIKAVKAGNLSKLLERDQLLVSRRRNPGFRMRSFNEQPIEFAPTYKYDVGTDRYDTSEKSRSPAWCDRVLYRGAGRIKPLSYERHEVRVSDHRPVSATFKMRVKRIDASRRARVMAECGERLKAYRLMLAKEANLDYLVSVLGVEQKEATRLIAH